MMTIIAAVAADGAIGRKGDLLWHLKEDLRHFKRVTMGQPVVMGRKTWESLPKRPLPGRKNIVISRNPEFYPEGADRASSLEDGIKLAEAGLASDKPEVFVIGGGAIYAEALPLADALELTEIEATAPDADTFFPNVDRREWDRKSVEDGEESGIKYKFVRYERIKRSAENSDNK